MITLLLACSVEAPSTEPITTTLADEWTPAAELDATLAPLDAPRLLRRMSLDLRGTLPTTDELDQVEANPDTLTTIRDVWLEDPRFEERLVAVLGERWLTEVDEFLIEYTEFPALAEDPTNEYAWERAVGQEPLRLMARIAAEDRPWTDIVTADTTMANEALAASWPIEYSGSGWQEVRYTDGRPAAGILSTNGLWWRYYTTFSNYNRMRVGALARLLLCVDYLSRPVSFSGSVSLADSDGIEAALQTNPYCLGCHSAIDPMAASLFGFWTPQQYNGTETVTYHPERELLGEDLLAVEPAWYGEPLSGLADLGLHVAADPRFGRCTAQTAAELYWRREVTVADFDRVEGLRQAWIAGDKRWKPLVAAVTDTAVYRAGGLADGVTGSDENTSRMVDLTLLASVLDDLAGFSWTYGGWDQLRNDTWGFRILGGGVDGTYVTRPQRLPGLTWTVVMARVAEAAGVSIAAHDLAGDDAPWLLDRVTDDDDADTSAFAEQAAVIRWRLLARRATDAELAEDAELFSTVASASGAEAGWAALIQAWLRDPAFVRY